MPKNLPSRYPPALPAALAMHFDRGRDAPRWRIKGFLHEPFTHALAFDGSPVDIHDFGGNEFRRIGRQKQHGVRHIKRIPCAFKQLRIIENGFVPMLSIIYL